MHEENQLALIDNIPQDSIECKKHERPKRFKNCVADVLNEVLFERKINLAKVHRDTNIPFPTLDDWVKGKSIPLADDNLMVLAKYLNVPLEFLCFGLGEEEAEILSESDPKILRLAAYFKIENKLALEIINGQEIKEDA